MNKKSTILPKHLSLIARHAQAFVSGINQLSISPLASMMTFCVIGIVLALPMGLFVLLQNIQGISHSLHDSTKISLYLNSDISVGQLNDLERMLKADGSIENIQYISPDDGLKQFQQASGLGSVLDDIKKNPLPGVMLIQPAAAIQSVDQAQSLKARLQRLPKVSSAVLDMQWLQRLRAMIDIGNRLIYSVLFLFAMAVLLIIGNTIRLIVQNNRQEIMVTKLLGAENSFIRRPFLYVGIIYGLMGSIIAWLLVDMTMWFINPPIQRLANLYGADFSFQGLSFLSTLLLLFLGILLGYFGSLLIVNKYIRAIEPKES
jgi:cell division transport system permease protein